MSKMMMTVVFSALVLQAAALPQTNVIEPGDTAVFDFREPIVNGLGANSLADFHGNPILVEFWGHR